MPHIFCTIPKAEYDGRTKCGREGYTKKKITGGFCKTHFKMETVDALNKQRRSNSCVREGCCKQKVQQNHCTTHILLDKKAEYDGRTKCGREGCTRKKTAGGFCKTRLTQKMRLTML